MRALACCVSNASHHLPRRVPDVKPVGKPDAVAPHVRFDERGEETELWCGVRHRQLAKAVGNSYSPSPIATAPLLDSTFATSGLQETAGVI